MRSKVFTTQQMGYKLLAGCSAGGCLNFPAGVLTQTV